MELCGLPKARPITCSPDCLRRVTCFEQRLLMEHGAAEDHSIDMIQGCKIATGIGTQDQHVGDTPRLDAPDVTPTRDVGKVAGCRCDSFARREADPMQQCEFEVKT